MAEIFQKKKARNTLFLKYSRLSPQCGRWGETETEKGPVDLFPVEPTDEATYVARRPWSLVPHYIEQPKLAALEFPSGILVLATFAT